MNVRDIQQRLVNAGFAVGIDGDLGPQTYAALFAFVGRRKVSLPIADLGRAADKWFIGADLVTPQRIRHALAQWAVETGGFSRFEENLDYSAARLCTVWPKRFPTLASAAPYAGNPRALANKVYGGRGGNTGPDDGWRFRGRGPTQLTFHDNYAEAAHLTGIDLVSDPDSVTDPDTGLMVACAYWKARGINHYADTDDLEGVRVKVNGGNIGIDEARRYLARAAIVLQ